jgi:zinc protease
MVRLFAPLFFSLVSVFPLCAAPEYLVLLGKSADDAPEWRGVAEGLAKKHQGEVATWDESETGLTTLLRERAPRFLAIVNRPEAFDSAMVRAINRATRKADPDVWTDCQWGLVSGSSPADAMRIVETTEPLVIRRALCTTGIRLGNVESALVVSDAAPGKYTVKEPGGEPVEKTWDAKTHPAGTVELFAEAWNRLRPQLLVTSAHATQFNLEMPFGIGLISSHNGKFHVLSKQQRNQFARFLGGAMFKGDVEELGRWIDETKAPVLAGDTDPKVWVACGNCLIGDARKTNESMVISAISGAGVRQFLGYVVPTWYGKNGWGASGLWQESEGRLSLSEAFFLNTQSLMDRSMKLCPGSETVDFDSDEIQEAMRKDRSFLEGIKRLEQAGAINKDNAKDVLGLIHDRDTVALWGDPKWRAGFASPASGAAVEINWSDENGTLKLTIKARRDFKGTFPVWLPRRIQNPTASSEGDGNPDLFAAKDFLWIRSIDLKTGQRAEISLRP